MAASRSQLLPGASSGKLISMTTRPPLSQASKRVDGAFRLVEIVADHRGRRGTWRIGGVRNGSSRWRKNGLRGGARRCGASRRRGRHKEGSASESTAAWSPSRPPEPSMRSGTPSVVAIRENRLLEVPGLQTIGNQPGPAASYSRREIVSRSGASSRQTFRLGMPRRSM